MKLKYYENATLTQPNNPDKKYEITPELRNALKQAEETDDNLFITGGAGTGKSVFIELFSKHTKKKVQKVAFTGLAAFNISGRTIHKTFGIVPRNNYTSPEDVFKLKGIDYKLLENLDVLIIDEISMVRSDLLKAVSDALTELKGYTEQGFGGIQVILVGDPLQLQPIYKPDKSTTQYINKELEGQHKFFYFAENTLQVKTIEFIIPHRQIIPHRKKDNPFINILNNIRFHKAYKDDLTELNKYREYDNDGIYLTTTNKKAEQINDYKMKHLDLMTIPGEAEGEAETINEYQLPTKLKDIKIAVGMRVVIVANKEADGYVNGTQGIVSAINIHDPEEPHIVVIGDKEQRYKVTPHTWTFSYNTYDSGTHTPNITGSFKQYPLVPGYATTVHKSQGQSYDKAVIDLSYVFAFGQTYVSLSRVRSIEGIKLIKPITPPDVFKAKWARELKEITDFIERTSANA